MLPAKDDPKWARLMEQIGGLQLKDLAAQMMINRVKLRLSQESSAEAKDEAIRTVYEFFTKNEASMAEDIRRIFS